jgi:hypothetical protein
MGVLGTYLDQDRDITLVRGSHISISYSYDIGSEPLEGVQLPGKKEK